MGGVLAHTVLDVTVDPAALDGSGFWAVLATFEGEVTCVRFAEVVPAPTWSSLRSSRWIGPGPASGPAAWTRPPTSPASSAIRAKIAAGDVYQVNLCRVMSAPYRA